MSSKVKLISVLVVGSMAAGLAACGARSGLDLPEALDPGTDEPVVPSGPRDAGTSPGSGRERPLPPPPGPDRLQISAGWRHTCAVRDHGVLCWGLNFQGQLGDGTTVNRDRPVPTSEVGEALEVSAGVQHTCALLTDGAVRCWGTNENGQLGDGGTESRLLPAATTLEERAVSISAAGQHSCALVESGDAWCWGHNAFGQLGDGTLVSQPRPVRVHDLADVVQIDCGTRHTCAVLRGGRVACWGAAAEGQLGTFAGKELTPVLADHVEDAVEVSAGALHSCARTSAGDVWCWGSDRAALAHVRRVTHSRPARVPMLGHARNITTGDAGWSCAVLDSGAVTCWPIEALDPTDPSALPQVQTGLDPMQQVTRGYAHTCAQSSGDVWCWGSDAYGQLGDGAGTHRGLAPVEVRF